MTTKYDKETTIGLFGLLAIIVVVMLIIGLGARFVITLSAVNSPTPFTEPSASATELGQSGAWRLYKLSVHGQDEFVWVHASASSVVQVPPPLIEKK